MNILLFLYPVQQLNILETLLRSRSNLLLEKSPLPSNAVIPLTFFCDSCQLNIVYTSKKKTPGKQLIIQTRAAVQQHSEPSILYCSSDFYIESFIDTIGAVMSVTVANLELRCWEMGCVNQSQWNSWIWMTSLISNSVVSKDTFLWSSNSDCLYR